MTIIIFVGEADCNIVAMLLAKVKYLFVPQGKRKNTMNVSSMIMGDIDFLI